MLIQIFMKLVDFQLEYQLINKFSARARSLLIVVLRGNCKIGSILLPDLAWVERDPMWSSTVNSLHDLRRDEEEYRRFHNDTGRDNTVQRMTQKRRASHGTTRRHCYAERAGSREKGLLRHRGWRRWSLTARTVSFRRGAIGHNENQWAMT
jgi:hypothetical protein